MAKGKIPGVRNVRGKEARELLKLPWVADEELLSQLGYLGETRVLPDGRVFLRDLIGESGTLYPSRAAAEEMNRQCAEAKRQLTEQRAGRTPHPAVVLLPPIDDFLRDVEIHAKSLGPRLRIPEGVLDGTVASLGAVDKALKRIPRADRQVADLMTPLVAYVGEVFRRASGGRWIKVPPTYTDREDVYAPGEFEAYWAARNALRPVADAAAKKAETEARARRASKEEVALAINAACEAVYRETKEPKPIRSDMVERPRHDSGNSPVVVASNGHSFDPFSDLFVWMVEPSKRNPPRATVEARLHGAGYPQAPKPPA